MAGGSIAEAIAGAAGVVLALIGLAGLAPLYVAPVASIALGVAFLAQGGALALRWSRLVRELPAHPFDPQIELGSGMSAELLGGAAGIVLGILALLGTLPVVLTAAAVVVFGATLLFGSALAIDLTAIGPRLDERRSRVWRETSFAASGTQLLAGVAAIVLGVIALGGVNPLAVSLIGLLIVAGVIVLTGATLASRLALRSRRD